LDFTVTAAPRHYDENRCRFDVGSIRLAYSITYSIRELLGDTGDRVNKQLQNADDLFTFLRDAVEKFNTKGFETRRRILSTLGQNLSLKDKILSIDWEKSLLPSQKLAGEVRKIHERLEPAKNKMSQGDLEEIYSKNPIVCAQLDSNQRPSA
jgi:hypothetical protein